MSQPSFQEYAELVARQLAALEAEDLALLTSLADQRDALATVIDHADTTAADDVALLRLAAELEQKLLRELRLRRDRLFGAASDARAADAQLQAYARAATALAPQAVDLSL